MECERKGKFFGACRFQPRYDVIGPTSLAEAGISDVKTTVGGIEVILKAMVKTIYVGDVCVRCGTMINRPSRKEQP